MSDDLWDELPYDFLKKTPRGWMKLDRGMRTLVVDLARSQNFKCAFCDRRRKLIIEHDHNPDYGRGDVPTIYNTRGLACSRCNWHLGMFEADERGHCRGWENAWIRIAERDFYPYAMAYEQRVYTLVEGQLERRMDPLNYWRRRSFLRKFDDWRHWGGSYPWRSHFREIRERKRMKIRTPEQFIERLKQCMKFFIEEKHRNPDFSPPETFWSVIARVKPMIDDLVTAIEHERLASARFPTVG